MTRFMREEVVLWDCWAVPVDDCSRSSMEILLLRARYNSLCLHVSWQYVRISVWREGGAGKGREGRAGRQRQGEREGGVKTV